MRSLWPIFDAFSSWKYEQSYYSYVRYPHKFSLTHQTITISAMIYYSFHMIHRPLHIYFLQTSNLSLPSYIPDNRGPRKYNVTETLHCFEIRHSTFLEREQIARLAVTCMKNSCPDHIHARSRRYGLLLELI